MWMMKKILNWLPIFKSLLPDLQLDILQDNEGVITIEDVGTDEDLEMLQHFRWLQGTPNPQEDLLQQEFLHIDNDHAFSFIPPPLPEYFESSLPSMDDICTAEIPTIIHPPKTIRSRMSRAYQEILKNVSSDDENQRNIEFYHQMIFSKVILYSSPIKTNKCGSAAHSLDKLIES